MTDLVGSGFETSGRRSVRLMIVGLTVAALVATGVLVSTPAAADTAPAPGTPETVTGDALPTAQINGVAWTQTIAGNTVYVGGDFSNARPAGSAAGVNTTGRANLLAYDLTTGALLPWNPGANAQVRSMSVSPDGSTLYVGGTFTQIAGQTRYRVAAFSTATGALLPWAPSPNATVYGVVANGSTVWISGTFSSVGGQTRTNVASVSASTGAVLPFQATVAGGYGARGLVVSPGGDKVVVIGSFTSVNGSTNPGRGMAALNSTTGALVPWAANSVLRNAGNNAAMYSVSSDSDSVYVTGYDYGGGAEDDFEGAARINWSDGALIWMQDCHGDTYGAYPVGDVVYTVSHAHYCGNIGSFPQTATPWVLHPALAFAKAYDGVKKITRDIHGYRSFTGQPGGTLLHWYPDLQPGTYTGQTQAAWAVAASGNYVVMSGEFLSAQGRSQQGLVRFAKKAIAPRLTGPQKADAAFPITASSLCAGAVRLTWVANTDKDNQTLTYQVFRQDLGSTPIYTTSAASNFWTTPTLGYVDQTAVPGQSYSYRVRAVDPDGNQATGAWTSVTVSSTSSAAYNLSVSRDRPSHYWPLGEQSDTNGADCASTNDLTVRSATRNVNGPNLATASKATQFSGSSSSYASPGSSETGANTLSVEAWFKTSSTSGGKIVGFGNAATGGSSSYDRQLYIDGSGRVSFGLYQGSNRTLSSATGFNNNQWHHVVGTVGPVGMNLFVDGKLAASRADTTGGRALTGFWRIGGDNISGWTNNPSSSYLNGAISDVAIYSAPLSPTQVNAHWMASGRPSAIGGSNQTPTAAFAFTTNALTASFNGSASADPDGSISSYTWTFGDGSTGTGMTPSRTYAAAGIYNVTLTVTDNAGATNSVSKQVTVAAAPNQNPVAAFASSTSGLTVTVNGSSSADPDGSISSYAWTFGDGSTGTGATASRTYASGGAYNVTLTVTDNRGGTNSITKQVTVTAPVGGVVARDAFGRTVVGGWGTADQGGAWTVSGVPAQFSVSSGAGVMNVTSSTTMAANLAGVSRTSATVSATFSVDKIANSQYVAIVGRQVGANQYILRLRIAADGSVILYVLNGGTAIGAGYTVPGLTITPGTSYTLKFQAQGTGTTNLAAKAWPAASAEPAAWQMTRTDAAAGLQTAGSVGVFTWVPTAAGVYPVKVSFTGVTVTE
ncbi:PKD domain-containing protein [Microbacterium sp.]|uniref:PKD domain-containing protein n=1 Tax=Microbacterium sp. TaxID=51671 RepID=UPI003F71217D